MRVLQVIPYFAPSMGGTVAAIHGLSRALVKKGCEVEILTTDYKLDEEFVKIVRNEGIGVTLVKCDLALGLFLVSPSMKSWLRTRIKDFDIIHMHEFRSYQNNIVRAHARRNHIPYVVQPHGSILPFFEKKKLKLLYDFPWGRRILNEASAVIALNRMEERQCLSMGVKEDRIRIIPNGISASEFENLPERGAFRTKFGIGLDWPVVLYLGRIHRIKGLDLLLAAFAPLAKELKNARLIIAGPDDGFLRELENQARSLGIEDRIITTGPLYDREKLEAYVDADAYVLPSQYEIFGITILEAASCGTPVVATKRCGISDFVVRIGYVVDYDSQELGKAILEAINTKKTNKDLAYNLRNLVKQEFQWDNLAEKLEDIYEEVVDQ
jgi:glycosyltransferase involved in cell wall biosynthesis